MHTVTSEHAPETEGSNNKPESSRIHFVDNVKGILIVLVVIGHVFILFNDSNEAVKLIFRSIYLFHMPLFVFISGFLAKRTFIDGSLRVEKILSFLVLAFLFQFVLLALGTHPEKFLTRLCSLSFEGAPWYLLSLATWSAMVPLFCRMKPLPCIAVAFCLSLLAGFIPNCGNFLGISRTIVFMPYFLMGYYCSTEQIKSISSGKIPIAALLISIAMLVIFFVSKGGVIAVQYPYVYANFPYGDHGAMGMLYRTEVYVIAIVLSVGLMALTPKKESRVLSTLGKRTLQIYILHRIIRSLLSMVGLFDAPVFMDPVLGPIALLLVSAALVAFCSIRVLGIPFTWLMGIKWTWLVKKKQ